MPITKIYLRKGSTQDHRDAISDAIHQSLVDVLGIPDDDKYRIFHQLREGYLIAAPVAFGLERRAEAIFISGRSCVSQLNPTQRRCGDHRRG